jgi:hypothetical protein
LGERLPCVLHCPHCGEKLDVDLSVSELLVEPYAEAPVWREALVEDRGVRWKVRYRLPQGADQEAVADAARTDPQQAAGLLLRRCLEAATEAGESPAEIPAAIVEYVAAAMCEHDPQAELRLDAGCANCESPISALLDTAFLLLQELQAPVHNLYREVHTLALYYHWSEKEILNMTAPRRRRYLDLIADSTSRQGA